MIDPVLRLAQIKVIKASAEIEAELSMRRNFLIPMLDRFRDKAAESLAALAFVDAENPKAIRLLQNEVKKYDELMDDLRSIVVEGIVAEQEITDEEREEYLDLLVETSEGQQEAVREGLIDDHPNMD
jgi:hypothetical protein